VAERAAPVRGGDGAGEKAPGRGPPPRRSSPARRKWREAEAIRAYCDGRRAKARSLAVAREHTDQVRAFPRMPPDPEITPEPLKPYLRDWRPYGPTRW
jgi:hypothetical protein